MVSHENESEKQPDSILSADVSEHYAECKAAVDMRANKVSC